MVGPLGIRGVHHIAISVPDLAIARRFYVDILGAVEVAPPMAWRDNRAIDRILGLSGSAADMLLVRLGNVHFEIFAYQAPAAPPQDPDRPVHHYGYTHFAVQVDDVADCYERILAAGLRVHAPPLLEGIVTHPDGTKTGYAATYCRDFFGNVFEIMEIHPNDEIPPL
ncbi:VOC family protein [Novosphingobium piscinae]|uniref:VOC family protein n=1 Tax=Novosphingobium piscinae TaxID=1507448 RepID=A0A7X1KPR1_9SPHN|nr:VOC family protein [Novosphingobium piscinae]MBC2668996.1 VOC family protein [Novosphingobium piscinae]